MAPHFPQLEILELIGQGGMGAVYKARQPGLDRLVALKVLPREVGDDPTFAERFTREARALARLIHPHIVAVHDFGQVAGLCYFVMEYVDGVNLREMLAAGHLQPREALAIVPQICEALQFAHDEGIVHRDVKPENVLVDRKGRVKMADFGLAKLLGIPAGVWSLTQTGQVMGTPHYMAPEQIEHPQDIDHRADIYALGVVFYEMLTGELPLGRFEPPSHKVRVDVRLDEVVLRTLEKEPKRRYQHASQVQTAVEAIARGPAPPPPSAAPAPPPPQAGLEEARAQVTGPAIGLIVTGALHLAALLLLVVPFVLYLSLAVPRWEASRTVSSAALPPGGLEFRVDLGQPGAAPAWMPMVVGPQSSHWAKIVVPGLFILLLTVGVLPGVLVLVGAAKMMRLRSYRWATAASIVAFLPSPVWLLGLGMGIWSLVVLSRPAVKAAFAAQASAAAQARPGAAAPKRRWLVFGLVAAVVSLPLLPILIWELTRTSAPEVTPQQQPRARQVVPPKPPAEERGNIVLGPEGPALREEFARVSLKLQPAQIDQFNQALQDVFREYQVLEKGYSERSISAEGHAITTIKPFVAQVTALENRLWSRLDAILSADPQQQAIARYNVDFSFAQGMPEMPRTFPDLSHLGAIGWTKYGGQIDVWRVGAWYHWKVRMWPSGEFASRGPQLPEALRRFWQEPAEKGPTDKKGPEQKGLPPKGPAEKGPDGKAAQKPPPAGQS